MRIFYFRHNSLSQKPYSLENSIMHFNELTIVIKGELSYIIDGQPFIVKAGDCLYLKTGTLRQRLESKQAEYISFNFYDDVAFDLPTHLPNSLCAEIKMLLAVCDEIYLKSFNWADKLDKALELILYVLEDGLTSLDEKPVITAIKRFIKNNLKEKLSLAEISKHVGYSPSHCDTLFKNETGVSIINFLIEERITEAKRLLQEGYLSLKKVAENVGFLDYNFFSRTFKKITGKTPTEYKSIKRHK